MFMLCANAVVIGVQTVNTSLRLAIFFVSFVGATANVFFAPSLRHVSCVAKASILEYHGLVWI